MPLHLWTRYWRLSYAIVGCMFGRYIDTSETIRMSDFANKSKLYGRELNPGEETGWDYYLKK